MNSHTIEYLRKKRRNYLFLLVLIGIFGLVLFIMSHLNQKEEVQTLIENKGFTNLYEKISKSTMDPPLSKTSNILKFPKFLPYRIEGKNLFLEKPFTLNGKKINDAVFKIKSHGNTLFSESFSSDSKNLFCRGTVKKGSEKFIVYYCDEK